MSDIYFNNGINSIKHGDFERAINDFSESIRIKKTSAAFSNRAYAYCELGKNDLAKKDYTESMSIVLDELKTINKTEIVRLDLGIISAIDSAVNISGIDFENGNFEESEKMMTTAIEYYEDINNKTLVPKTFSLFQMYSNRGMARLHLKKLADAADDMAMAYLITNSENEKREIISAISIFGFDKEFQKSLLYFRTTSQTKSRIKKYVTSDFSFEIELIERFPRRLFFDVDLTIPKSSKISKLQFHLPEIDFDYDMSILVPDYIGEEWVQSCLSRLPIRLNIHFQKYGRLLPPDLELYIAETILVMKSIGNKLNQPIEEERRKSIFKFLLTEASETYNIPLELKFE